MENAGKSSKFLCRRRARNQYAVVRAESLFFRRQDIVVQVGESGDPFVDFSISVFVNGADRDCAVSQGRWRRHLVEQSHFIIDGISAPVLAVGADQPGFGFVFEPANESTRLLVHRCRVVLSLPDQKPPDHLHDESSIDSD